MACFLIVSLSDKEFKPTCKLSRITAQYSLCSLQNASFRTAITVQAQMEQVIFLRATRGIQGGLFVYQLTLRA